MPEAIQVSAIVCNLNGKKFLPRLIDSLRAQRGVDVEIIVVDRESKDGSLEYLARMPDIKIVSEPAATGLVAGYHAAVPAATHDLLFFCNEDLWLDRDCLSSLARHLSLLRKVGAADPWQWSYDGARHVHAGTAFVRAFLDPISCYPPRAFHFLVPLKSGNPVPFGCAGAVLVHRQMYLEAGGWDSSFFMDFDDVDFFLRAWQRGWMCVSRGRRFDGSGPQEQADRRGIESSGHLPQTFYGFVVAVADCAPGPATRCAFPPSTISRGADLSRCSQAHLETDPGNHPVSKGKSNFDA